ncbi:hypothetical protein LJK87_04575 [Paenibacillus sp. P25]|nr:hypothetical protein LJK87_04575 [Paenibacillus sp. P25]
MRRIKAVLYAEQALDYYHKMPPPPDTIQVIPCTTEETAVQEMRGSDVLCCTGMFFPKAVFEAGPRLQLLHSISVGMEPLLCREVLDSGVTLTNSRGANAKPVAEHAVSLMLALTRNIHLSVRAQRRKSWRRSESAEWNRGGRVNARPHRIRCNRARDRAESASSRHERPRCQAFGFH